MNDPWNNYQTSDETHRKHAHRAQTAPAGGLDSPLHPRSLMPGRAPRISISERSNLFFANQTRLSISNDVRNVQIAPTLPAPFYPAHVVNQLQPPPPPLPSRPPRPLSSAIPHHPSLFFERSISSPPPPPPIPPKIPLSRRPTPPPPPLPDESVPVRSAPAVPITDAPVSDTPTDPVKHNPPMCEHDFAEAIAVSKEESAMRNKISLQEDEDLARALKASLLDTGGRSKAESPSNDTATKSEAKEVFSESILLSLKGLVPSATEYQHKTSDPSAKRATESSVLIVSPDCPMSDADSNTSGDEAYARQLAQEERNGISSLPETRRESTSATTKGSELPQYASQFRNHDTSMATNSMEGESPDDAATLESNSSFTPPRNALPPAPPRSPPFSNVSPPSYTETTPPLPDITQTADGLRNSHNRADAGGATILTPPIRNIHRTPSFNSISEDSENEAHSSSEPSSQGLVNVNSFVDKELFIGVTVGFTAPTISTQLVPLPSVMPNIISLPYGRGAPLHLQGPTWRHLLKLMAKLSGTRLEPTVAALAISKTDFKLRTVIQLIKPHPSTPDWRTILYFTMDYPPPQPVYHHNVNELPFSYTLSPVPTLLHQASDTPVSKIYTIPSSEAVPYPTLPITFPSLATYLQAALEESRRYLNDNSSNHRKLARMVQTCYKSDDGSEVSQERHGVSGLFKKVIGRNNKSTKPRRGGNEDTYELVTPFVADEWG